MPLHAHCTRARSCDEHQSELLEPYAVAAPLISGRLLGGTIADADGEAAAYVMRGGAIGSLALAV